MKGKGDQAKTATSPTPTSEVTSATQVQTDTTQKDEEFQLLNALEIFWNINSDNIELLKQNWGWKCASCKNSEGNEPDTSVTSSVYFHVYETKRNIQGDVLTIKPEYLQNILETCRTINPSFLTESPKELYLFNCAENMYKYFVSLIPTEIVQSWADFEQQLTKIIEYKVLIMFYAVSSGSSNFPPASPSCVSLLEISK